MSTAFTLVDATALDDLATFVDRAARIEDGAVRLIGGAGVLAVYAAVIYPIGLMDESPTVLGLRTYAISAETGFFDAVVPVRSFQQRIESAKTRAAGDELTDSFAGSTGRRPVEVGVPAEVHTVTWAGISPPRGGWHAVGDAPASLFDRTATEGVAEVAAAVPDAVGEQIVRKVRAEVWGRPIEGLEHIPAGAAFAQLSLGFLGEDEVRMFESGPWTRLTTRRGHVLIKRKAWTLAR